jgi:hypothetical protein
MAHRRRRVFIDTPKGRVGAGFIVPKTADAADYAARAGPGALPVAARLGAECLDRRRDRTGSARPDFFPDSRGL